MISDSKFTQNEAKNNGGVFHQVGCSIHISGSNFSHNTGKLGGVIYHNNNMQTAHKLIIKDSNFFNNSAERGGGIYFIKGTAVMNKCQFGSNAASEHGGAIFLTFSSATISSSWFENNKAVTLGGALRAMNDSQVYILRSTSFKNNSAFYGAAIHSYRAKKLELNDTISITENNGSLGIFGIISSKISFLGNVSFADNVGSLFSFGSYVYFGGITTFSGHKIEDLYRD